MRTVGVVRGGAVVLTLGVLALVAATASARLRHAAAPASETELVYLPDARVLRPLALGYDNVLADVLWFRTISYFGQHYEGDRVYPWLASMCELVTDLDPRADHVYQFCGLVLPWEAGQVAEGIRILEKARTALPDVWRFPYYLGITHFVFRNDQEAAAAALRRAATLPGAPPLVASIAATIHGRGHGPQVTIAFLREMLRQADSAEMRAVITERLADAQFAANAAQLSVLVGMYRERIGRQPTSLEELVAAGFLPGLAADPYGGRYVLQPETGTIRSSTGRAPREARDSPRRLRQLAEQEGR